MKKEKKKKKVDAVWVEKSGKEVNLGNVKSVKKAELFEVLLPDFFDEDALKVPPQITYRVDNQGERLYCRKTDEGIKLVPSVSTILRTLPTSPHLIKWYCNEFSDYDAATAYVNRRADYGTFMHMMFHEILLGHDLVFNAQMLGDSFEAFLKSIGKKSDGYDLMQVGRDLKQDLFGFVQFCKQYKVKPLAIEYIVFGEKYGGAIDLVCKMTMKQGKKQREVIAQIDFKSGRKDFSDNNELQLHAYRELWNQEYPQHQIEIIANYGCKDFRLPVGKSEPYRFKVYKDDPSVARKWSMYVDLYHMNEIKIKDRVEFSEFGSISINSDLSQLVQQTDIIKALEEKMEDQDGRQNTTGNTGDKVTRDRKNKNRAKGSNRKRKGEAEQSGLF